MAASTAEEIRSGIQDYGMAPGGKSMISSEMFAAKEALASGVYITWVPPSDSCYGYGDHSVGDMMCARVSTKSSNERQQRAAGSNRWQRDA